MERFERSKSERDREIGRQTDRQIDALKQTARDKGEGEIERRVKRVVEITLEKEERCANENKYKRTHPGLWPLSDFHGAID